MEMWKDVVGFEEYYQVSNYGRVRCKEQLIKYPDGHVQIKRPRIMMGNMRNGYHHIDFKIGDDRYFFGIHRLVAKAFIPNPENKKEVNHINGDKLDNLLENLEWVTRSENQIHAVETGLKKTKTVGQYDFEGNLIKIHKNVNQAAIEIGKPNMGTNIRKAAQGKRLHACNYKWKFIE